MKFDPVTLRFRRQHIMNLLTMLLLMTLLSGCAATSTTIMDEELVTNQKPMSSYKSLHIRKFELKRELFSDVPEAQMGSQERRYTQVPGQLADHIQRYVKARRIYDNVSQDAGTLSADSLVLTGKFTKMGRFRISLEAFLLDGVSGNEVAYFRQTLWDVFDTTEGIGRLGRDVAGFIDRIQYK